VNSSGKREALGLQAGNTESYISGKNFFKSLQQRSLRGVYLVTSDDHSGLVQAINDLFPDVICQRCQTHFSRNLPDKVPRKEKKAVHSRLNDLYNSPELQEAYRRRDALFDHLKVVAPKAIEILDK
jgi:putative transposase